MSNLLFLSSSLFLGWSLGANDAANIFGTAVGTRMIRFQTAALVCCVFVIIGAVISGSGTTETLGQLGRINAMPGAFVVAASAALTVFWMTRFGLPTSTSQAIVGAILGWNFFADKQTETIVLSRIVGTWIFSPILAAILAIIIYFIARAIIGNVRMHMFSLDLYTRIALLAVGAFGAYSLGANNIANVMGVFVEASPFEDLVILSSINLSGTQQLFFIGGISIAVGVVTYSKKVMLTVGNSLYRLSPITAFIVVLASSLVLFLFASQGLKDVMITAGLPSFPLVPVSQSQAVVGAIMGISLAKGVGNLNYRLLGSIGIGWLITPVCSALLSYVFLFFMQNVFTQPVYL